MIPISQLVDTAQSSHEAQTLAYLQACLEAFERAALNVDLLEETYRIAGHSLRVRLAGTALKDYAFPALNHLKASSDLPTTEMSFHLFDTRTTGVAIPSPIWPPTYGLHGVPVGYAEGRVLAAFNRGTGVFTLLDTLSGYGIYWLVDAHHQPQYDASSPLRILLHWWMRERNYQYIHAGAVGNNHGAVLLVGKGGSGKSTSTMASLLGGLGYVGDDYVLLEHGDTPYVHNLYQSGKLNTKHLAQSFPELESAVWGYTTPDRNDKAIMMLSDHFPGQIISGIPVLAIVFPQVTNGATRLREADSHTGLRALLPSTVRQLPSMRPQDIQRLAVYAERLPSYVLEVGEDIRSVPSVLQELLI